MGFTMGFISIAKPLVVKTQAKSGDDIPIEQRDPREVTHLAGQVLAPEGVDAAHPAFDVTPHDLISAIITEQGIVEPPFEKELGRIMRTADTT